MKVLRWPQRLPDTVNRIMEVANFSDIQITNSPERNFDWAITFNCQEERGPVFLGKIDLGGDLNDLEAWFEASHNLDIADIAQTDLNWDRLEADGYSQDVISELCFGWENYLIAEFLWPMTRIAYRALVA